MSLLRYKKIAERLFFLIKKTNIIESLKFIFYPEKFVPNNFKSKKNYNRFILLGHPRSGSTLIKATIQTHPNCIFYGEIFHASGIFVQTPPRYDILEGLLVVLRNLWPIQFLNRYIFQGYSNNIKAVGFKLFPEQVASGKIYKIYDWLESNTDVKIILLNRKNLLKYLVSLEIAKKRNKFYISSSSERSNITIKLEKGYCEKMFLRRESFFKIVREKTKKHQCLEMQYEDLLIDSNQCVNEIQRFIGLEEMQLEVTYLRQEYRTLPEILTNYWELKQQFSGSKWEHYFED